MKYTTGQKDIGPYKAEVTYEYGMLTGEVGYFTT
jgi:hypothetical protein